MNGHGPTSTTTSHSSSTNWAGISSASNNRTGRSNTCLALQSLPISANTSARHTDAQSGDQPLVVQHSQSSLQPTPICQTSHSVG
jgi:hypothetical protein